MSFYKNLGNTAARLIKQFGQVAYVESAIKTNDAITGVVSSTPTQQALINVVITDYQQAFGGSFDNTEMGKVYLLASNDYVLEIGQKISINKQDYFITNLNPFRPSGEVVAYGVEVKA